jgi:perosamine synthetase
LTGAKPVLVDADPVTWCIDPARIEERITPRTKAILVVHMYGHPCDMDPILAIARRHGLHVIEDAAEAHGARYKDRPVGAIGEIGCFSFYGNKILTTGEGGMVVTNDQQVAERVRVLRNQAFEEPRFVHRFMGFNYRLTNLQAAIGLAQCETLEEKVTKKRQIAQWYTQRLKEEPALCLPAEAPWAKNVYWMYGVVLQDSFGPSRDVLMDLLKQQGIETRAFFYPLHRQPVFLTGRDVRFPETAGAYPVAERLGQDGLYLPSGLGLTEEEVERVVEALRQCRRAEVKG